MGLKLAGETQNRNRRMADIFRVQGQKWTDISAQKFDDGDIEDGVYWGGRALFAQTLVEAFCALEECRGSADLRSMTAAMTSITVTVRALMQMVSPNGKTRSKKTLAALEFVDQMDGEVSDPEEGDDASGQKSESVDAVGFSF